ncbi:hypothetical protein MSAN_01554100 [Mycena sanguinolenta]|uniref:Uncharacterized protein n=1 Tax=Mycena sanguinolenta TaxID=230812 RepID=A0A8H6Y2Y8_9AGAR|nr:hypothetical protein MSAN_01554100 [Mycena sanguinolenta]
MDIGNGAPTYEPSLQRASMLKRRRSMPEIMAAPPPYTMPHVPSPFVNLPASNNAHPLAQARIASRGNEGCEVLPPYTNGILLRALMPRKMEFSAPKVQAQDRKWRRVLCELVGTVLRVYRCAGEGWWERWVGDVATAAGPTTQVMPVPRRSGMPSTDSRASSTVTMPPSPWSRETGAPPSTVSRSCFGPSSDKGKSKSVGANATGPDVRDSEPDPANLIRAYTLQHGQCGLANDCVKRKYLIRVRLEGEQFFVADARYARYDGLD